MKKLIVSFSKLKLRTKIFFSYVFIILLLTIINIITYNIYESNMVGYMESSSLNLVEQLSNNISYKLSSFDTTILYATSASEIFDDSDFSDSVEMLKDIYTFNTYIQNSGAVIDSDIFIKQSSQVFYYSTSGKNKYESQNIYQYIKSNKKAILDASGRPLYVSFKDEPGVIYVVKTNIGLRSHMPDGILALGISDTFFKSLFPKSLQDGSVVVCDGSSNILISDEQVKTLVKSFIKLGLHSISGQNYFNYKGENMIIESSVSENSRWKVLYVISVNSLLNNIKNIKSMLAALCLGLIFLSTLAAFFISGTLTSNLRLLLKKIKSAEHGDFTFKAEPRSQDETAELFNHFDSMSNKINELINRVAYAKIENKRAEYNALLAQMNPHFLYNVLDSINGLAKLRGQEDIVKIISSLSYLLRISISEDTTVVRFRDELHYVKNYISIQQIILGDRLVVEFDIEDDTLGCMVPKLITQPIVENAIKYGVENKNSDAIIIISAHRQENVLKINISDNGGGIAESFDKSETAGGTHEDYPGKHTHIGIKSVDKRLKILYGEEYGLAIKSDIGIGTVAEISIPTGGQQFLKLRSN